jgi:hypothetical protein
MAFGNLLDPNTYSRRDNRTLQDLLAKRIEQQIDIADANARTRAADQAAELAGRTMDSRVSSMASEAKGLEYGLPVLQQQGRQAEIGMGFLDQMFPKAQPQVPPHLAAFGPQPEPQAPMGNAFADKSLADLRALKSNAGPVGEFLGGYVDPIIAQKSMAEEMTPALQEIATIAKMPGGTKEQLRDKSAALSAIAAKYPSLVSDPKFKEAIDIANPKNSDVIFNPFMAGVRADTKREKLGKESVTFASMVGAMNDLDKAIGGIFSDTPIAGFQNRKILGGGWGAWQKFAETPEGAAIRIPLYALINKVLKREAGTAVTENEFERIKNQYGVGLLDSESAFRTGVRILINQERDAQRQLEAAYGEDAKAAIKAEGGMTSDDIPSPKKAPAAAKTHPQASAAEKWARANPNDPRAKAILERLAK